MYVIHPHIPTGKMKLRTRPPCVIVPQVLKDIRNLNKNDLKSWAELMMVNVTGCFLPTITAKNDTSYPKNILSLSNRRSLFLGRMVIDFEVSLILVRFQIRPGGIDIYNTRYGIPEITPSKTIKPKSW